jgi:uncharacterized membrane protein
MPEPEHRPSDQDVEQVMGDLLRCGVILAALVVLAGGVVYLSRHATETPDLHVFHGEPGEFRSPSGVVEAALHGRGRGIIQLGLLLLIATPVARVIFSVIAFARQRDHTYILLTLFVLAVLVYSLCTGYWNP